MTSAPMALTANSSPTTKAESPLRLSWRRFTQNRFAMAASAVVLLFLLMAIFAPWIAPQDPNDSDLLRRLQAPVWMEGGEWAYPLGCDALGRDLLSRIIYGSRVSIFIGCAVIFIATAIGVVAGLLSGYLRGWVDTMISRVVDILLAFPYLLFAIGLMAMMGPGLQNIILALAYKEWVIPCRLVRGETMALREVEYIEAARAVGASKLYIMAREILPNILSSVIVVSTLRMAHVIILEASLSFLGIGVQPPTASWGSLVADGRSFIWDAWWISTFSGVAILLLVLAINVASQGLRDAFDPRLHE
ncbi:MAG: peptide ABC transporter permease [Betaproteobacteria bacterium HGW-Betaproteobacteria-18]|nr:MAG: peptide ABC transporter permease [Betaproteobacteria bacterium HGW-Betaproteobacteria-18]